MASVRTDTAKFPGEEVVMERAKYKAVDNSEFQVLLKCFEELEELFETFQATPKLPAGRGWKTTEFWVATVPVGALLLMLWFGRITPDEVAQLWPMLVPSAGYGLSRGMAK